MEQPQFDAPIWIWTVAAFVIGWIVAIATTRRQLLDHIEHTQSYGARLEGLENELRELNRTIGRIEGKLEGRN